MTNEASDVYELAVRVIPNASRDEIVGWHDGALKIKIAAQPEAGKANKAICALLVKRLKLPKHAVEITHGHTASRKRIEIVGMDEETIRRSLADL
ncbi:MAG: DUF167 domain-containing protein [Opitutaceae bacterium]